MSLGIAEVAKTVQGKIEFVSPTADPQSGLSRVRVRLPNPKERLPCGATCYLLLADVSSSHFDVHRPMIACDEAATDGDENQSWFRSSDKHGTSYRYRIC